MLHHCLNIVPVPLEIASITLSRRWIVRVLLQERPRVSIAEITQLLRSCRVERIVHLRIQAQVRGLRRAHSSNMVPQDTYGLSITMPSLGSWRFLIAERRNQSYFVLYV